MATITPKRVVWHSLTKAREKAEMNQDLIEALGLHNLMKGDLSIFCGAGISLNSGLPLADQLKGFILEKLTDDKHDREEILKSKLPFEVFMETVFENYSPRDLLNDHQLHEINDPKRKAIILAGIALMTLAQSLTVNINTRHNRLLQMFREGQPNSNHILLAKLMNHHYARTILTTNFDLLLESALEKPGQEDTRMAKGDDFQVLYDEDQFAKVDLDRMALPSVFKIHGSVESVTSIRTTLEHVASKTLSENRARIIDYVFRTGDHKKIIVLGYSCSDIFDITPQIESVKGSNKEIILVLHINGKANNGQEFHIQSIPQTDTIYVCDISESGDSTHRVVGNPFKNFQGWVVTCSTDSFVRLLWASIANNVGRYQDRKYHERLWMKDVDRWCSGLMGENGQRNRCVLMSALMYRIGNYAKMKMYTETCLELLGHYDSEDNRLIPVLYNNMALAYSHSGNLILSELWRKKATEYLAKTE